MKRLIVVDMQNDFVSGALGTPEAEAIIAGAAAKIRSWDGEVVFTQDTHPEDYLETQEGRNLPVLHCVKGTEGWELNPEIQAALEERGARGFEKPTFGSLALAEDTAEGFAGKRIAAVELIGICTDICVVSNALLIKAHAPELPIRVDSSCCAGVSPANHNAALDVMRSCQIDVI